MSIDAGIRLQYFVEGVLHRAGETLLYPDSRSAGVCANLTQINTELQAIFRIDGVAVFIEGAVTCNSVAGKRGVAPRRIILIRQFDLSFLVPSSIIILTSYVPAVVYVSLAP